MKYTVVFKLSGALKDAVAVEWTDAAAPVESGEGWEPCVKLGADTWRMASYRGGIGHWREAGLFGNIALRYRLEAAGPWSPISAERKDITLVAVEEGGEGTPTTPPLPVPVAPLLLGAPVLAGTATIGTDVTASTGEWDGTPVPALAFQWLRDGAPIDGATAASYRPVAADDLCALACRVVAANTAGTLEAVTEPLTVRYAPPVVTGELFDEVFDEGIGAQDVNAALAFVGENLRYAVTGKGATIDEKTGLLLLSTDTPVSGETIEVTASNSGGEVKAAFLLTVEAIEPPEEAPRQPGEADWGCFAVRLANGKWTGVIVTHDASLPEVDEVEHIAQGQVGAADEEIHYEPTRAFDLEGFTVPAGQKWWITCNAATGEAFEREPGTFWNLRIRYCNKDRTLRSAASENFLTITEAMLQEAATAPAPATPVTPGTGFHVMAFRPEEAAAANVLGGCMEQHCHSTEAAYSEPNFAIMAQDILGVWGSEDFGKTWSHLGCEGLMARQMMSANIDPANANVLLGVGVSNYDVSSKNFAGFYKSTDRGKTWALKTHVPDAHWERSLQNIAWAPSTRTLPESQRIWYAAVFREPRGKAAIDGQVWRSTDGGESWTVRSTIGLNATTGVRGRVRTVFVHPTNPNLVYLCTSAGIFRSTDGAASWTAVSGSGGLPWGQTFWLEINPQDGNEMYIAVQGGGLFRTTNGGANWSSIAVPSGMTLTKVFVGLSNRAWPAVPSRKLFLVGKAPNTSPMRVSHNGGATWTQPPVSTLAGWPTWQTNWHKCIADPNPAQFNMTRVLPHQIDGEKIFAHALSHNHRSEDGGKSFGYSGSGFTGITWSLFRTLKPAFTNDPNRYAFGVHDIGCMITKTGGDSFWHSVPNAGTHASMHAIAMHPTNENMVVSCVGAIWGQGPWHIVRTNTHQPGGNNWSVVHQNTGLQLFMHWNRHNPNVVYAANFRSTNQGANWSGYPSNMGSVCAVYPGDNNTIYGRTGTQLRWSRDAGATSELFVDYGYPMNSGDTRNFIIAVHPTNPNIVFTKSSGSDLARFNRQTGQWKTDYNLRERVRAMHPEMPANYPIDLGDVVIDPQDPNVVYVAMLSLGYITIFRSTNGQSDNPTWENITHQWPRVSPPTLAVHPQTGDLMMAGDGFGSVRCLPAPGARSHPSQAKQFAIY